MECEFPTVNSNIEEIKEIFENTKTFLRRLLEIDMELAPFHLVSLEGNYHAPLEVNINGRKVSIHIGGKIDRVDKVNDTFRILDYKTGNVEFFSFKEI